MIRTQIYLTAREKSALAELSRATGKKQSELIRKAVDRLIEESGGARRKAARAKAAGMWKDRRDLPDLRHLRNEWDRH